MENVKDITRNEIERMKKLIGRVNSGNNGHYAQNLGNRKRKKRHLVIKAKKAMKRTMRH